MINTEKKYKYWAFISYARADKDIAIKIHKLLEKYRTPKSLVEESRSPIPRHFCPIFIDLKDLSTTDPDYRDGLKEALKNSKHLIVLCSESSARPESVCHWEINTFLESHSSDAIMPIALEDISNNTIPVELHDITNKRNVIIWDKDIPNVKTNNQELLKIIAFLLGITANDLYDRHKHTVILRKKKLFMGFMFLLILFSCFSIILAWQFRSRLKSEYRRAEFEKKVFPYSLVYAYANNFIYPVIKADTYKKTIFVIAMPKNYSELNNHEKKKKDNFSKDAATLGWFLKKITLTVPNRTRPLNVEKMYQRNNGNFDCNIYADMVTTVTAIKSVVDYLTAPGNPYYKPSQKEAVTKAYIEEFKKSLLNLEEIKAEKERGNLEIYFADEASSLKKVMQDIESKYNN